MEICASCGKGYYWIIDRDYLAEPGSKPGTNENAAGVASGRPIRAKSKTNGHLRVDHFVIKDDDGISYYSGRLFGGCGFEPLDDFGMPNAGATEIWIDGELL